MVDTERRKFIWGTVASVALAVVATVAQWVFPSVPWLVAVFVFVGGVLATIIAFLILYFMQGKTQRQPSEIIDAAVSGPRESREYKRIPIWNIVILVGTWIVPGAAVFYGHSKEPEYTKGLSRQEIGNVEEELSHVKPRTMVLECADTEADRNAGLGCIPLINTFHYMFLD